MIALITIITSVLSVNSENLLFKRSALGVVQNNVRMTYYGSDFNENSGTYVGDVPPFAPYGIGACAQEPLDHSYFVAMNAATYDQGVCGYCAKITYGDNCVVAPIVDKCPGCGGGSSGLDVSIQAFSELVGSEAQARFMGVAQVNFEVVVCPANRAATGSPMITDVDPCSGSSSGSIVTGSVPASPAGYKSPSAAGASGAATAAATSVPTGSKPFYFSAATSIYSIPTVVFALLAILIFA